MSNVQETLVAPSATIKQVIETIDRSAAKVALVVDDNRRLLGTVTDGDVRRGLLRGVTLSDTAAAVMNGKPHVGPEVVEAREHVHVRAQSQTACRRD